MSSVKMVTNMSGSSSDISNDKTNEDAKTICNTKAASVPRMQRQSEVVLNEPPSAPFYFHSLKENEAPPFRKPGKEPILRLLIDTLIKEDDVIEMVAAMDIDDSYSGYKKRIVEILVRYNIVTNYHVTEKYFLVIFVMETISYAAQRDFNVSKLACLLSIYLATHLYFKWYYWISPAAVWKYFRRLMIKHTIEDSPDGQEVFEPEECYDIMSHFHTNYLCNLPLVHILTFEVDRLKIMWPFNMK
ncbi:uncharacterized protein LOC112049357 [Bicyclus anynana]|uniref:Uncharacterized protein LOC112049357 n=1 Tax=Bicyclus anynana TaxID=110368 RepID=A0A6J1ND92_BICAN|nr:uncharacterized protein LOC112049357 [Bicyclus anynana]